MASAGKILLIPKGDWVKDSSYKVLDITFVDGSSYISKRDIVKSTISPELDKTNWQIFCKGISVNSDVLTKDMAMTNADIDNIDGIIVDDTPDNIPGESISTNDIDAILNS